MRVAQVQRDAQVLFDQQDRHAFGFQLAQDLDDLVDNQGRQAFGRFVEQDDGRIEHQGARDGHHLLLAARELEAAVGAALLQARKQRVDALQGPASVAPGPRRHGQVFLDGETVEDAAFLRHEAQAQARDAVRGRAAYIAAAIGDAAAARLQVAHDGQHGGGLAGAVASQDGGDLAVAHLQRHVAQHVAGAVVGVDTADFQHQCFPPR